MSNTLMMRLAEAMAPNAFAARSERPEGPTDAENGAIVASTAAARSIVPVLAGMGIDAEKAEALSLKDDMEAAYDLIGHALKLLARRKEETRGDLDDCIDAIEEAQNQLQEQIDDICCTRCGEFNNDGEGFDGLCGNCADRDESDEGEDDEEVFPRANDEWPTAGDRVAMSIDEDVEIVINTVWETQFNLHENVWIITDQNGDVHLVEDEGTRWETVNPETRNDVTLDPKDTILSFDAMSLDEGVDDGDGGPERIWRGIYKAQGEIVATTDLLYATPQEACLAAVDLQEDKATLA